MKVLSPRKLCTKRLQGLLYRFSGVSICMIRPEDIKISPEGKFAARIISKAYFGQYIQHYMDIGGQEIEQMDFSQSNAALEEGSEIAVDLVTDSLRLLPGDDSREV